MSHRTIRQPSDEERSELKRIKREEVGRVAMRAHMMLLSDRGLSAFDIADLHDVTHPTVYKWMDRFDEEGPEGLFDREREGRPRKIDDEVEREIEKLLQTDPTEEGENASRWTTPRIAEYLERELGVDVHPETVREALKRLEYSWTRPRRSLRKGPDYEERLAELAERIGRVGPETIVLFADETEVKRFPPLRRMWQPVGEQRAVWVPEQNGDFALYGALDICTGETYTEAFDREVSDHTIEFLKQVRSQTTGKVLLIWDQASWHTSKQVQDFIEDLGRFETLRLPKRAPEANPMEDLWRELKEQVAACLERSLEALRESCRQYFQTLSPQQALRTAGIGYE
ncbi:hypothetical protein CRI93_14960 [Longimonas halophila]|uniref:Tc1-like transposase DDE domain-containing protein n=1 Tax=Longimonas halophila TaxID=1469170 RepID=A0A2H3NHP0_9BACT|nr:IS630 family transposase [Longimonas halophila]PEN04479.1 hypothetical protein CRI93_14960 [Longimonas halophila]